MKYSLLFILSLLSLITACQGTPLKSDETVLFFPTSANQGENSKWNIKIHHWVFEKEEGSFSRKISLKLLTEVAELLDITEEQAHSKVFQQRLQWFLVDNERNKSIEISFAKNQQTKLKHTASNGHAKTIFPLNNSVTGSSWLRYKVVNPNDLRKFVGEVQLIPKTGLTVISDIDDTIKISNVLDKKELIKNTFLEPYRTTQGMPEYYKKLQKSGAYFHYVSASPWQLYPSLKPFMRANYPLGTMTMRNFRLKDSSIIKFLQPSIKYKTTQINQIIKRYPKHQFILIGDSGEHDPKVYADIFQQFPTQIKTILIRAVNNSDLSDERFKKVFKHVPQNIWKVFSTPAAL